jgi:hypothetical protein
MDKFTQGYLICAIWSSNDESTPQGGEPLDKNFGLEDIAPASTAKMEADCQAFQQANAELLNRFYEYYDEGRAGHDFWLNRNGHGSGFWDEDGDKAVNKALSDASKACGEQNLYVGDDGIIYLYGAEDYTGPEGQTPVSASLKKKGAWPLSGPTPADEGNAAGKAENIGTPPRDYLLAALQSKPLTTGEAEAALGGNRHSNKAYPLLKALQQEGLVKQKQMRWYAEPGPALKPRSAAFWNKAKPIDAVNQSLMNKGWVATHNAEGARRNNESFLYSHPAFPGDRIKVNPDDGAWQHSDKSYGLVNNGTPETLDAHLNSIRPKRGSASKKGGGFNKATQDIMNVLGVDQSTAESVQDYMSQNGLDFGECTQDEFEEAAQMGLQELNSMEPGDGYPGGPGLGEGSAYGNAMDAHHKRMGKKQGPRMAGFRTQRNPEWISEAEALIEADDPMIYDVAADTGQIVDNVKHMPWFVDAVAEWLEEGNLPEWRQAPDKMEDGVPPPDAVSGIQEDSCARCEQPLSSCTCE